MKHPHSGIEITVPGRDGAGVLLPDGWRVTPAGRQLTTKTLVENGAGDLFGIVTTPDGILAVNDGTNALELFRG